MRIRVHTKGRDGGPDTQEAGASEEEGAQVQIVRRDERLGRGAQPYTDRQCQGAYRLGWGLAAMTTPRRRLVADSVCTTRTAAEHFAHGYRGGRFGKPKKPRGSVRVDRVGRGWGVFDYDPQPRVSYITVEQGKKIAARQLPRRKPERYPDGSLVVGGR